MKVRIGKLELAYTHPFGLSRWTTTGTTNLIVCVEHEGIAGWGEGSPNRRYHDSIEKATAFVRKAAGLLASFHRTPETVFQTLANLPGSGAGHAAIDIALHDWISKKMGIAVYEYMGFGTPGARPTSFTIGIDDPFAMMAKTREAGAWSVLKVKVGTDHDADILDAVRSVTDKPLRVDTNEGWTNRQEALSHIRTLKAQGVELVEQPIPAGRLEDVRWLRKRSPIPLIADEDCTSLDTLEDLAAAYDGVNIKLDKCGGLFQAARMVRKAEELGMDVMLGCMLSTSVATTAAFHLASKATYIDLDGHLLLKEDPFIGAVSRSGLLELRDQAGIGVNPKTRVTLVDA